MEFFIEGFDPARGWYILGSCRTSPMAQASMGDYRRSFPGLPLRVVENPSRRLVVLSDPRKEG